MSRKAPLLATALINYGGYQRRVRLNVMGGLNYLRGNKKPYFSMTADVKVGSGIVACGAMHETILKAFPQFKDLADLHLTDIDGVPTHAAANGWYWYAGYWGGLGEQYHGGNSKYYIDGVERFKTRDECLETFARHVRISMEQARQVVDHIGMSRATFDMWIEAQKPRWKAEAEACIAKHNLVVFGEKWEG